ncbi:hypothetical protein ASF84_16545 [Pseudomonas sp. Leaf127]|uniref:hypothetical protein n=1 Tax=Pseudomonas sp. Leaf127 TaxID=1736267 RepID=UPI00070398FC|nr:hypothetical protein [Pseudomonas sp. Leaf127]KQQ54921.1 hypothetical protein ASF84_16545 [Pseudomonas sp. Leaf127]
MSTQSNEVIVNAGCLMFFQGVPGCRDILDSTLYAQLSASKKYSRFTDYPRWQQTWLKSARRFGWKLLASESYEQAVPCLQAGNLWDWVSALCPSSVDPALLDNCRVALSRCSIEQAGFTLLADQVLGRGAMTLSLQVGLVAEDGTLVLLQIHFDHDCPMDASKLFGAWSSKAVKGNIVMSVHRLQLSEDIYGPLRMAFAMALREHRHDLVCPLFAPGQAA